MILLPAIDLHEGKCVRLFRGDYDTAEVVAQDPLSTAKRFQEQGARWLHMVDLDGAKDGKPQNQQLIFPCRSVKKSRFDAGPSLPMAISVTSCPR